MYRLAIALVPHTALTFSRPYTDDVIVSHRPATGRATEKRGDQVINGHWSRSARVSCGYSRQTDERSEQAGWPFPYSYPADDDACRIAWSMRGRGSVLRAFAGGLLVAVGTAASLIVGTVHGSMVITTVGCAALAAGVTTYVGAVKKNPYR